MYLREKIPMSSIMKGEKRLYEQAHRTIYHKNCLTRKEKGREDVVEVFAQSHKMF